MAAQHANTFFVYALGVNCIQYIAINGGGVYVKVIVALLMIMGSFDLFMDTLYHVYADFITLTFRVTAAVLQPILTVVEFLALLMTLNTGKRQSMGYQIFSMSIQMIVSVGSALVHYYYFLPEGSRIRQ